MISMDGKAWIAVCLVLLWALAGNAQAQKGGAADKKTMKDRMTPKESIMKNMETIGEYFDSVNERLPISEKGPAPVPSQKENPANPAPASPQINNVQNNVNGGRVLQAPSNAPTGVDPRQVGYYNGQRDPFAVTTRLLDMRAAGQGRESLAFKPGRAGPDFPSMKLRGIIRREGEKIAALLEIKGGGTHVVREEDTVGLNELGQDAVVRIKKINRLNLVVEVGSLGQVMIVR